MHPQLTIINQLIISFIIHLRAHANRGTGRTPVYRKASPRCIDVTKARNNHHHHRRRRRRATIVASWENAASALSRPRSFELRSIHLVLVVFECARLGCIRRADVSLVALPLTSERCCGAVRVAVILFCLFFLHRVLRSSFCAIPYTRCRYSLRCER